MKLKFLILFEIAFAFNLFGKAVRVETHDEAEKILRKNPRSVLVFFIHGEDWCPAGETIKEKIWDTQSFQERLPDGIVLCSHNWVQKGVDSLGYDIEHSLENAEKIRGSTYAPVPRQGTRYRKLPDGSWMVDAKGPNPRNESIRQILRFSKPVSLLQITALPDPVNSKLGPGRFYNGNFMITEIELFQNGKKPIPIVAISPHAQDDCPVSYCYDGVINPQESWSPGPGRVPRSLYVIPFQQPIPGRTSFELQIHMASKFPMNTLYRYRVDGYGEGDWMPSRSLLQATGNQRKNDTYDVQVQAVPALKLFDSEGVLLGTQQGLDGSITADEFVGAIEKILRARSRWEELEKKALTIADEKNKIACLIEAYEEMLRTGYEDRERILVQIKKIDPFREYPVTWRVLPDEEKIDREELLVKKKGGEQAQIDYYNQLLKDPLLAQISVDFRQRLILRKYTICRNWKNQKDQAWKALKELVAVDPTTFLAKGAQGKLDMNGVGNPSVAFGWFPCHLRPGNFTLKIHTGVAPLMLHPGRYLIQIESISGKKPIQMHALSVHSGQKILAVDRHEAHLEAKKDKDALFDIQYSEEVDPKTLELWLDLHVPQDHEYQGKLTIEAALPEDGPFGWK